MRAGNDDRISGPLCQQLEENDACPAARLRNAKLNRPSRCEQRQEVERQGNFTVRVNRSRRLPLGEVVRPILDLLSRKLLFLEQLECQGLVGSRRNRKPVLVVDIERILKFIYIDGWRRRDLLIEQET